MSEEPPCDGGSPAASGGLRDLRAAVEKIALAQVRGQHALVEALTALAARNPETFKQVERPARELLDAARETLAVLGAMLEADDAR